MDLWYPPDGQPQLLEWWQPALIASSTLRQRRYGWLIHIDELMLMGRIDRSGRPSIWVYKHKESRREIYLDATGAAYKYTLTPNARSHGRFSPCPLEVAVWRADLPAFVTPTFYEQPPPAPPTSWPPPTTKTKTCSTAQPTGRRARPGDTTT